MVTSDSRLRRVGLLAAVFGVTGCYTLQPVGGQPVAVGDVVSASLNDAGRQALGGQMGPAISDIEGRLLQSDSSELVLAVAEISLFGGGSQVWAGERVRVKREYISVLSEKRFSRGRTAALGAVSVAVLVSLFSQSIKGFVTGDEGKPPVDTLRSMRYPRFGR